ncbi:MAG: polysaccharide biosynthesis protein [Oscillospiraceae bacterium]|nr:polysaccharide biosynthesis protein [Oscillospiraceae bacterium]
MVNQKKQNFLFGSVILIASTLIVKIIGCFFKIPLQNLIGSVGMGYFSTSYALFNLVYALSVAGLPMAVAKMVASSSARHEYKNTRKILRISNISFLITGLLGSVLMAVFSRYYVDNFTSNPDAYWCTIMMAPSILFCCISSAYRGYYEGLQNMYPTAISQVIEAVIKLCVGYFAAWYIIKLGWEQYYQTGYIFGEIILNPNDAENTILKFASAAGIFGVTVSTFLGALYIWLIYIIKGDGISKSELEISKDAEPTIAIFRQLIKIAIPICLAAAVMNIASFIDTKTMVKRLALALNKDSKILISQYKNLIPSNLKLSQIPNFLYGAYSGMSVNIFNLIPSLTTAFSISILPVVTAAVTKKDNTALKQNMECVLRITNLICVPASLALVVLSKPILIALYGARANEATIAVFSLRLLGIAAIFVSLAMPINSMLQAVGKINTPAKLMITGVVFKLILNQYLISNPAINIKGAPIGTIVCYGIVVLGGLFVLLKTTKIKLNIKSVFIKPFIGSIICIATAYLSLELLNKINYLSNLKNGLVTLLISIIIAVIIYMISLLLMNAIEKTDILMLPGGKKFLKTLEKYRFLV